MFLQSKFKSLLVVCCILRAKILLEHLRWQSFFEIHPHLALWSRFSKCQHTHTHKYTQQIFRSVQRKSINLKCFRSGGKIEPSKRFSTAHCAFSNAFTPHPQMSSLPPLHAHTFPNPLITHPKIFKRFLCVKILQVVVLCAIMTAFQRFPTKVYAVFFV